MAGYRCALHCRGLVELSLPTDIPLREFLEQNRPDGIVCANDLTAARLMHDLLKMGYRIPEDIRTVGVNDVKYAGFLPVPLTTLRQPCDEIGGAAMSLMLDRRAHPESPTRDLVLDCELVVRQSCGTKPAA